MARLARADVFDPAEVSVFHCINRCVRRCFLCGDDPLTGKNFDHRKAWLEKRLEFLAGQFGIDILGFAILANHFHLVLRNRPDVVATWDDSEVARRWLHLCPARKMPAGQPAEPTEAEFDSIRCVPEKLAIIRRRLSDISWLMRMIAEPIARQANREDRVSGRFWQGRFRAVRLCDESAVLACMAYVDLNPIRAGLAETLETSDFTSIQRRIEALSGVKSRRMGTHIQAAGAAAAPDAWLAPIPLHDGEPGASASGGNPPSSAASHRASDKGCLPMELADYLVLLDWTGRQMVHGKSSMPQNLPPILTRLGIESENWLPLVSGFGKLFHRVAGAPRTLGLGSRWRRFRPGRAALLGTA